LTVLPLAIVMSAGPQIITVVFLATSRDAKRTSLAFLAGVAGRDDDRRHRLLFHRRRLEAERRFGPDVVRLVDRPPARGPRAAGVRQEEEHGAAKWMGRLQTADARFAGKMGLLLYLLMPTDVISMATVGAYLASQDAPWWQSLGFVGLTVLIAGLPLLAVLLLGRRAETLLPKVRTWMSENSWIVNEAVILFFLAMALFG
jgi:Sap-like sulfolipid-1-addressing protein